ncbi:hypothetical protein [Thermogutta sp.]|uniref:hypothetical protein n=1 Tax=Thermogutta sp. TaxID=1962930 RepID=UPI0032200C8E
MPINQPDGIFDPSARLAGGYGPFAAMQEPEALLRRAVMTCLLGEDIAYQDGTSVMENIRRLVPQVAPETVFQIAVEARRKQKLRRVPLLLAREMARYDTHKHLVADLLPQIILRPDELWEFLALYWDEGRCPLSAQVKKGLSRAFENFDLYQFSKYARRKGPIRVRDVMFLTHPKPTPDRVELFRQIANDNLPPADTWEVALSAGADARETFTRLILERRIGALAFLRNLRNMEEAGVDPEVMRRGFETISPRWLLPLNFLAAAQHAPRWEREIEALMFKCLARFPRLPGYTIFVVDVSGSMYTPLSAGGEFTRLDAAAAMAILAAEACERIAVYATAGNDSLRQHATALLPPRRGFALRDAILQATERLGHGGIFTRQCLEYIRAQEREDPDRIIVFSDSQDCDYPSRRIPQPFGKTNYIIDVSSHDRGINYHGVWTAEVSGWSEHFLEFIAAMEGLHVPIEDE